MRSPGSKLKAAFSLVEVSLALAIVGIAFMALLGILPMGMQTFKAANDTTVDARMLTVITSMLQSTEYSKISGAGGVTDDVYFFDMDGEYLDSARNQSTREGTIAQRVYAAKVVADIQKVPSAANVSYNLQSEGARVLIASGKIPPQKGTELPKLATDLLALVGGPTGWPDEVRSLVKRGQIKVRPLIVARFEGLKPVEQP